MIADRNKTALTCKVTAAAYRYLHERGCKPLETEVYVADGWVADIAGILSPTNTDLIDLKLLKRKPGYRHPDYQAWHEAAKLAQILMTVLVEVKTSRADFRGDRKWTLPTPTNLSYVAIPAGLVSLDEMPQGWGVLEYSNAADYVKLSRIPSVRPVTTELQLSVTLQVAYRRDSHTRYERLREFRKGMTAVRNEDVSLTRMNTAMRAMLAIVKGDKTKVSVEGALAWYGIKRMPAGLIEELEQIWAIADKAKGVSA